MRKLYDIIESAKDGQQPTYHECYYAMLVLTGLVNMATSDVERASRGGPTAKLYASEAHRRYRQALATSPKAYLGDNVPGNPSYDKFRALGKRLILRSIEATKGANAGELEGEAEVPQETGAQESHEPVEELT